MASALSPVYSQDLRVKALEDEGVDEMGKADLRYHSLAENADSSFKNILKMERWQHSLEIRESSRQSREHEEPEPRGLVKREENGMKRHSSFEEEPPHPVSDKPEDYNKEAKYAFPRKSSMELFSPQPLCPPAEQKEFVTDIPLDKREVKGQAFEEKMEFEGIVTGMSLFRGRCLRINWHTIGEMWIIHDGHFN